MHVTSPSLTGFVPNAHQAPDAREGLGPDHDHDSDDKAKSSAAACAASLPQGLERPVDIKT